MNLSDVQEALPEYEIEEELGSGSLSVAYRARRRDDGKQVSIKVVPSSLAGDPIFVRRFLEAAGRAIRLDHANIARVYEADQRGDIVYVVRQYVDAETLNQLLARTGPLPPTQASTIVRQLASALDHAHSRRLMHGDISDRSIYVESSGRVVLTDFGLAQSVASNRKFKGSLGDIRMVAGVENAAYLAPERVQGQSPSRAADIYALGAVAYQLLAGQTPFAGDQEAVLEANVYKTPAPLQSVNRGVSMALSGVVARSLSKKPELRYSTATEFSRAFLAAAEGISPASMTGPSVPVKAERRTGIPAPVAVVLALVLGLLLAFGLWHLAGWGGKLSNLLEGIGAERESRVSATASAVPAAADLPTETPIPPSATPMATATVPPTATPAPVESQPAATVAAPPTAAQGTVAAGSPFSNLVLARGIDEEYEPLAVGDTFDANADPVYLFYDYNGIAAGTTWGHIWLRGDEELARTTDTWPADWGSAGTAWVYYAPQDDYQPGAYEVQLLIDGSVVASAGFVMR
jgi:serine/threonine protein kinase